MAGIDTLLAAGHKLRTLELSLVVNVGSGENQAKPQRLRVCEGLALCACHGINQRQVCLGADARSLLCASFCFWQAFVSDT